MKKAIFLLASLILLVQTTFAAIPEATGKFVNDFAGVFTQSQTNDLEAELSDYATRTSNQICVVVVDNLDGIDSAQDYAMLLGNKWGIGSKRDNGVMLIVKVKNETSGDVYLAAGYGVENILTSELCGRIIDEEMIPSLSQEDYFEAVRKAVLAIESHLGNQFVDEKEPAKDNVKKDESSSEDLLFLGGFALVGLLLLIGYLIYKYFTTQKENKSETFVKNNILKARSLESYENAIGNAQGVLSEGEIESAKRTLKKDLEKEIKNADSIKQFNRLVEFAGQIGCVIDSNIILEKKKEEILAGFGCARTLDDVVKTEQKAQSFDISEGDIVAAKQQHLVVMRNNALDALCKAGPTEWAQHINAAKQLGCSEEEISRAKKQSGVNIGLKAAGKVATGTKAVVAGAGAVVAGVGIAAVSSLFGNKKDKDDKASSTNQAAPRRDSALATPRNTSGSTRAGGGGQFGNTGAGRKF